LVNIVVKDRGAFYVIPVPEPHVMKT